tara:strand:- start:12 stop:257 length:246 start_codon:yes stop_codon:yes gene_type:complete
MSLENIIMVVFENLLGWGSRVELNIGKRIVSKNAFDQNIKKNGIDLLKIGNQMIEQDGEDDWTHEMQVMRRYFSAHGMGWV